MKRLLLLLALVGLVNTSCSKEDVEELIGTSFELNFQGDVIDDIDVGIVFTESDTTFATGSVGKVDVDDASKGTYTFAVVVTQKFNVGDSVSLLAADAIAAITLIFEDEQGNQVASYISNSGSIKRTADDKIEITASMLNMKDISADLVDLTAKMEAMSVVNK